MPLASSSYPLLNVFWTIFIDIFRSQDLSGGAKALWFLFVLFIPLIGVLVYLIARGGKMQEHAVQAQRQQDQEFRAYVQEAYCARCASLIGGAVMTILTAPVGRLADHVVMFRLPSPDAGDVATVDNYIQDEQLEGAWLPDVPLVTG